MTIRVLLVDDHPLMLAAVAQLLAGCDDIEVVATASDGAQAVVRATEHAPDVILMDFSMPGMDGVEATRRIIEQHSGARVVMLTSFSDREGILRAIDAGAVGYLLKDADPEELLLGIRAAARGESPMASKAVSALVAARTEARGPSDGLSGREREVLTLVSSGLANKQIALRLRISEKTVKAHLTNIFQRLGVSDRLSATLWAQRHGLCRRDPPQS